jgi:hypothetical protein
MDKTFAPRLDSLPPPQRRLWPELVQVPAEFVLYGGTALALQLGHRESADFDFFARGDFDPDRLAEGISFMLGATQVERARNTVTAIVDRSGPVQVSFFGLPRMRRLAPPLEAPDNGVRIASILDLAATKAAVVQKRAEAKDYLDLDAILMNGDVDLPVALSAARAVYGESFNPQITLKALSFFGDGNLGELPDPVRLRLVNAVRGVDLDRLPPLAPDVEKEANS